MYCACSSLRYNVSDSMLVLQWYLNSSNFPFYTTRFSCRMGLQHALVQVLHSYLSIILRMNEFQPGIFSLNPCDIQLWNYFKSTVYGDNLNNLAELKDGIQIHFCNFLPGVLRAIVENEVMRFNLLLKNGRGHIEWALKI